MPRRDKNETPQDRERFERRLGAVIDYERARMGLRDEHARELAEVRHERTEALAALKVIALDPSIAAFLLTTDPKALEQVHAAIDLIEGAPQAEEVAST